MTEPLGYLDFLHLEMKAQIVITDSGGIQEETTFLQIPCLTLRENTERPITISEGTNQLVKLETDAIVKAAEDVLNGNFKHGKIPDLWDGHTSERIVQVLKTVNRKRRVESEGKLPVTIKFSNSRQKFG